MPFSGLRPLYKALTERRYTPYFGFYHFTDSLYKSAVQCRAGQPFPYNGVCRFNGCLCESFVPRPYNAPTPTPSG